MTFSLFRLDSLESRIVVFFVVLLMSVQMAGFFAIRYAIEQSARTNLRDELDVGVRVFKRLLEQNSQQLVEATAVLSYDFGFREAVSSQDRDTILSALSNHSARIKANGMVLVNLQNEVVADTLQASAIGKQFAFPELIVLAKEQRRSSAIRLVNGTIYQIVVVPVLAPLPCTILKTPGGKPATAAQSANNDEVSGAHSGGFTITVLPAASAGPSFQVASISGAFHGVMMTTTPAGSCRTL